MKQLQTVLKRAFLLPARLYRTMLLLLACVFFKSLGVILWEVGSVGFFLESGRFINIGFDFLWVAVLLSVVGYYILTLERRKGYGAVWIVLACLMMATAALWEAVHQRGAAIDVVFILKYGVFVLMTGAFWAVATRFISIRLSSLKFAFVFCAELVGMSGAGALILAAGLSSEGALIAALFAFIAFIALLKVLTFLAPMPGETFVKKSGGVQDVSEKKLSQTILALSFFYMTAKGLMDAIFYGAIFSSPMHAWVAYHAAVWLIFGLVGLGMMLLFYHTRYIYTTLVGMTVFGLSFFGTAVSAAAGFFWGVALAHIVFLVCSHFYLTGYLQILPRPLAYGIGPRLKKVRLFLTEPVGFLLAAVLLLNIPTSGGWWLALLGVGAVFLALIFLSAHWYAQLLMNLVRARIWRGGPLIISQPRLLAELEALLKEEDAQTGIYALRMLEVANHPAYQKNLLRSLKHPSDEVRLFAVQKLGELYNAAALRRVFEGVLQKDESAAVRCQALVTLIELSFEKNAAEGPAAYVSYLDNKVLRIGAITGFLKIGGDKALLAMEGLQRLSFSKRPADNLVALRIISQAASAGLVRLVAALLKSPHAEVVKQALMTAGSLRHPQLLPQVFAALDDPMLQEEALYALKCYGKAVFPPIEKMILNPKVPLLRRKILVLFLETLPSGEGKKILIRSLIVDNQHLKRVIIQSIFNSQIIWVHRDKKNLLHRCFQQDIDRAEWLMQFQEKYGPSPTHRAAEAIAFLMRAVREDILETRAIILYQLLLLKPNPLLEKAVRVLLGTRYERYPTALGVVQDLLPHRFYQRLRPLLVLPVMQSGAVHAKAPDEAEVVHAFSEMLLRPPFSLNHWMKATLICALRKLDHPEAIPAVQHALKEQHPIVLEAAIWALVRLEKNKDALHQTLLKIPTSRLVHPSLDEILKG